MAEVSQTQAPRSADFAPYLDRDRLIDRLRTLVRIPSENPPGNEAEVAAVVAGMCSSLGGEVSEHAAEANRPSIIARWGSGGRVVSYCSHYDVVPAGDHSLWQFDPFEAHIEDGRMHGRGSGDAKGPIAAAIEAVAMLRSAGYPRIGTLELDLVADEETMGFKGAGYLVDQGIVRPDVAIVGEPTSLRVVHAQRGACWLRLTAHGVAAHGSQPERGVNAIAHMSEVIGRLQETLPQVSHPVLGGPTLSVGTIAGGAKVNIVPASCVVEVDRRTIPGESKESVLAQVDEAIDAARSRYPDLNLNVDVMFESNPFEVPRDSAIVRGISGAVEDVAGRPAELVGFRGASDARFLFEAGSDVVLCGPGDIALAHTARESIDLAELERGALVYAVAFANLLEAAE
jgi:succinyl-diaminopimelate desuccinylase